MAGGSIGSLPTVWSPVQLNAPDGQPATVSMTSAVVASSGEIHGRTFTLNTALRRAVQCPMCAQSARL